MGHITGLTVSINRTDTSPNNYMEPFLSNQTLSVRLHSKFCSFRKVKPYLIFLDIFSENNITITFKYKHISLITEFIYLIKKYYSDNVEHHDGSNRKLENTNTIKSSKYETFILCYYFIICLYIIIFIKFRIFLRAIGHTV